MDQWMIAGNVVDAAILGAEYARQGYAVRLTREEARPETWAVNVAEAAPGDPLAGLDLSAATGALVLCGSFAPAARAQVERLADEGALVLTLHREAVLNQDESFLMGIRSGAAAAIKQGRNVVVRSENWPEAAVVTRKLAAKRFIPVAEVEHRVLSMLARAAGDAVEAGGCRRLVAVGTDTCAAMCSQLGVADMTVLKAVAPGLPGLLVSGPRHLLLALKAGGTGTPDALVEAVRSMRGA
jgi:uncharacterized protein YgbK (DUF1537 family)